jgi:hypothetical protein
VGEKGAKSGGSKCRKWEEREEGGESVGSWRKGRMGRKCRKWEEGRMSCNL